MQQNCKKDHLDILDGIRGFLAFWVFIYHLQIACIGESIPWGSGSVAVDIFMLLSGFLMAYHWTRRKNRFYDFKSQMIDFYIRRFFRIAPLYYVLLTIAFLGQDYLYEMKDYINDIVPPPWVSSLHKTHASHASVNISNVLTHYSFLFGFFPKYASSNILPDWSIGLEMQFYLIFPFLMLLMSRFGFFLVVSVSIFFSFIMNKLFGLYLSPGILGNFPQPSFILFKINIFAAGISLALLYINKNNSNVIQWFLFAMLSLYNAAPQVWLAALFIVFVLVFKNSKKELFVRLMPTKAMKFLGDTSYSVYLIHVIIYTPILYMLFQNTWFMNLHMYSRLFIAFIFSAVPTYAISYILYRTVEIRGIQFGRNILRGKS